MKHSVSESGPEVSGSRENAAQLERDHYGDGALYDAEYVHVRGDVGAWAAWASSVEGRILEMACGTGRLTFPMARAGARVTGLDRALQMLARARARALDLPADVCRRVRFVLGDMTDARLEARFDAVLFGLNGLMHVKGVDGLTRALSCARRHLDPGGLLAADVFPTGRTTPGEVDPQQLIDPEGRRWLVTEERHLKGSIQELSFVYRPLFDGARPERATVELFVPPPGVLEATLEACGFLLEGDWQDLDRTQPFELGAHRRVIEARARKGVCKTPIPH